MRYAHGVDSARRRRDRATEGWDWKVVDVRSLVPFDDETVCASVRRTVARSWCTRRRLRRVGAEIVARSRQCFDRLARRAAGDGFDIRIRSFWSIFICPLDRIWRPWAGLGWS